MEGTLMSAEWTFDVAIEPAWIDYNGHLNDMAYAQIVGQVNERAFDQLELGASYLENEGFSLYTVDLHLRYLAEVRGDDAVTALVRLEEVHDKRVNLTTQIRRSDGSTAAEATMVYLNVNASTGKTEPFGPAARARLGI